MILVAVAIFIALSCSFFYLMSTVAGKDNMEHVSFSVLVLALAFGFLCARIYYVDGDSLRDHFRRSQLNSAQETVDSYKRALEIEESK